MKIELLKILIIEDDEIAQRDLARAIKKTSLKHEISFARDIDEIYKALEQNNWSIIISDYNLPGINGLEVLKEIQRRKIKAPVLMVTGQGDENKAVEIIKAGAVEYLSKDLITPERVLLSIRNALRSFEHSSQKEKALASLQQREKQLRETQRIAKLGSWEYDLTNEKLIWSEETYNIFGRSLKLGSPSYQEYLDTIHPEDLDLFSAAINDAINKKISYEVVLRQKNEKTGEYLYLIGKGQPFVEEGIVKKLYGTVMDVSELKKVEIELVEANIKAERLVKLEQEFLANMSHEIRTPMNAILGFTKILLDEDFKPEHKKKLESIDQAGNNLLVIINDILDFSKIKAGRLKLEKKQFDIKKAIECVADQLEFIAKKKKLRLLFNISNEFPSYVVGDSVRLNQILINLVNNAVKFTEKGFVEVCGLVESRTDKNVVLKFVVEDTGIGIPEEKQKLIFESFSQASSNTTRKYGGTGLGLTICKNLVELHDGEIWVESEPDLGSKFSFTLNYLLPSEQKMGNQEEDSEKEISLEGIKVLLVEDNEMNLELAIHFLRKWKVDYHFAKNGKEALDKIKEHNFHIVLMDISMPIMDGFQCTKIIRTLEGDMKNVPIIAMTANAFADDVNACFEVGMTDYISKPFDANVLKHKIYSLVVHNKVLEERAITEEEKSEVFENEISLDGLQEMSDGDTEFIQTMINIYIEETPGTLQFMKESFDSKDFKSLKAAAHKYRSPSGLLRLKEINNLAQFIEENCLKKETYRDIEMAVEKILELGKDSVEKAKQIKL